MIQKIEIFTGSKDDVQEEVNDFLEGLNVANIVDIKMQADIEMPSDTSYCIMVIYREV